MRMLSDTAFEDLWKNLKSVIGRFQLRMGRSGNYEQELIKIERTKFTHDHLQYYKLLLEAYHQEMKLCEIYNKTYMYT